MLTVLEGEKDEDLNAVVSDDYPAPVKHAMAQLSERDISFELIAVSIAFIFQVMLEPEFIDFSSMDLHISFRNNSKMGWAHCLLRGVRDVFNVGI